MISSQAVLFLPVFSAIVQDVIQSECLPSKCVLSKRKLLFIHSPLIHLPSAHLFNDFFFSARNPRAGNEQELDGQTGDRESLNVIRSCGSPVCGPTEWTREGFLWAWRVR